MVGVAQLVEHLVVVQDVAGSSPVTHPAHRGFNPRFFICTYLYFFDSMHSNEKLLKRDILCEKTR